MALIRRGGEADKLGNHYEALWQLKLLMELVAGTAESLTIENFDRNLQTGIDAEVQRRERDEFVTEFHSVKRQTATGSWTPSALLSPSSQSPLGLVVQKIKSAPSSRSGIFISQSHVEDLPELCDAVVRSPNHEAFQRRLMAGSTADQTKFIPLLAQIKEWTGMEGDELHRILSKLEFNSPSEHRIETETRNEISREVMKTDGGEVDVAAVSNHLVDFVLLHLGVRVTRQHVFDYLVAHGYCQKNLSAVPIAMEQVASQNSRFMHEAEERLVRSARIPRTEAGRIVTIVSGEKRRWVILTGDADTGKSCVLAQAVAQLSGLGIPTFAFRMDTASPADSMQKLKEFLAINWEPVMLLDGVAQRCRSVLIIDQVDALSEVSGRRNAQQWSVLRRLIDEAKMSPMMSIVLACRKFDLDYDTQIKGLLKQGTEQAERIEVSPLEPPIVKECLKLEGVDISQWSESQFDILRVPLHLDLFIRCKTTSHRPIVSLTDLYRRYLEQIHSEAVAAAPAWDPGEALHEVVSCFSNFQAVALDWKVVEDRGLSRQCSQLISAGALVVQGEGIRRLVRFFHDTFFDHVFAADFVKSTRSVKELLTAPGERQDLFRRTQCRQILALLREGTSLERARYTTELRGLLVAPKVRTHIKFFLLVWLNSQVAPTDDEWNVLKETAKCMDRWDHVYRLATWGRLPWFDLLNQHGQWSEWLRSRDERWASGVTWMFGQKDMMKHRGNEIAELFESSIPNKRSEQRRWRRRLGEVLGWGDFYFSDALFNLFLRAFDESWEELERMIFWQHKLRELPAQRPEESVKVLDIILKKHLRFSQSGKVVFIEKTPIWWQNFLERRKERADARRWGQALHPKSSRWLDSFNLVKSKCATLFSAWFRRYKAPKERERSPGTIGKLKKRLLSRLTNKRGHRGLSEENVAAFILESARRSPRLFAETVVSFAKSIPKFADDRRSGAFSELWSSYGHQSQEIGGALNHGLQESLAFLSRENPTGAKPLLEQLLKLDVHGLEVIVMNAWAENPQFFAGDIVMFFKEKPQRIFYQPMSWSTGNPDGYYARNLLARTHEFLSDQEVVEIERLVRAAPESGDSVQEYKKRFEEWYKRPLDMQNSEDRRIFLQSLRNRNHRRYTILSVLPAQRLSSAGRRKLTVWETQYGRPDHSPPTQTGVGFVGSPIEKESLEKMTDDQLLDAMRRYDGQASPKRPFEWSVHGLHGDIRGMAASQKPRFLALLDRMDDSIEFAYQTAIVSGLVEWGQNPGQSVPSSQLSDEELTALANRFAGTKEAEMAKAICWGLERRIKKGRPDPPWIGILLNFALEHLDPATESDDHSVRSSNHEENKGGDLLTSGINHVRGVACNVLAAVIFADRNLASIIRPSVPALISDRSMGVRACVIQLLIAWLNVDRDEAVRWFIETMKNHDILLHVPLVENFLAYASGTHSTQLAPLVKHMIFDLDGAARLFGVGQTARCAFIDQEWRTKVDDILQFGDSDARKKVAEISADAWRVERFRSQAARWLKKCFDDASQEVRRIAAGVFNNLPPSSWESAAAFGTEFVNSKAFVDSASTFVWSLDDADPMPIALVIQVVRRALDLWEVHKGTPGKLDALRWGSTNLATLLLLAYNNAVSVEQRTECLDLLDALLMEGLYGIDALIKDTEAKILE